MAFHKKIWISEHARRADKSAPTADRVMLCNAMIGPYGYPGYFVNVHNRSLRRIELFVKVYHLC